jgi:2-oxoglutarate ferredoxin oxidoreductase subunit gamma
MMKNLGDIDRNEILIVGKGGEGVVLIGEILGLAATLDDKFATQRSTYGASQRGETLFSEVVISNKPIQYSFVESPTAFIAMSQQGFDGYLNRITNPSSTILFIEWSQQYTLGKLGETCVVIKYPARNQAQEADIPLSSNIVMLSKFIKETNIISKRSLKQAMIKKISKELIEQNQKAIEIGFGID